MGYGAVSDALKGISKVSPPKFDIPKIKLDINNKFATIPDIQRLPPTVRTNVPDITTTHIRNGLNGLPSSKDFPDNSLMKSEVQASVLSEVNVKRIGANAVSDAVSVKGNIANVSVGDMDFQIKKHTNIEIARSKNDYKTNVKGVAAEVDPRLGDAGTKQRIDDLIETPDAKKKSLETDGKRLMDDPKIKADGKLLNKITQYGSRALMVAGVLILLIPGGLDAVVDTVETIGDPLVGIAGGLLDSIFGPIVEALGGLIKPLLIGGAVLGGGYLIYKFMFSGSGSGSSPSIVVSTPSPTKSAKVYPESSNGSNINLE